MNVVFLKGSESCTVRYEGEVSHISTKQSFYNSYLITGFTALHSWLKYKRKCSCFVVYVYMHLSQLLDLTEC